MTRFVKRLGIFALLVMISGVFFFPYNSYSGSIVNLIKSQMRLAGVVTDISDLRIAFPGKLVLDDVGLVFPGPGISLPLHLETLILSPRYLQLLLIRGAISAKSTAYNGTINTDISRSLFGKQLKLTAEGNDLKLEQYPLFKNYGASGQLMFSLVSDFSTSKELPSMPSTSSLALEISQGSIRDRVPVAGIFPLPDVSNFTISCRVESNNALLRLTKFSLISSIGKASGSGAITLKQGAISNGKIRFQINLNEAGRAAVGGYLALGAQLPVETPETDWLIEILFKADRAPRVVVSPE